MVGMAGRLMDDKLPSKRIKKEWEQQQMSFIIDQTDNFFFKSRVGRPGADLMKNLDRFKREDRDYRQVEQLLKRLGKEPNQLVSICREGTCVKGQFYISRIYRKLHGLLSLRIDLQSQQISFALKLLSLDDSYLRVEGKERVQIICKYISSRCSQYLVTEYNLAINTRNGEVSIKIPAFYFLAGFQNRCLLDHLFKSVKHNLVSSINAFQLTFSMISEVSKRSLPTQGSQKSQLSHQNFRRYYQYTKLVNMFLYICSQSTHEEQFLQSQAQREINSVKQLKQCYVASKQEFLSVCIYENSREQFENEKYPETLIDGLNKQNIKSRIEMPSMKKSNNSSENNYVLNYIKTKNKMGQLRRICAGGFTTIFLAEIEYWYVSSYNMGVLVEVENGMVAHEPHRKYIVVKRENRKDIEEGRKSRIAHEKEILMRIKNGVSIFLNKYYLLAEKDNDYEKDLLSDYIDYPNLHDYCFRNRETLSFQTKIYLAIMVAQSLRYLSEYKIVHLDLKPTNIMINRKLTIKLIDFGESYHPELKCNKFQNHQPGFSMPYSAPEVYTPTDSYHYKNDVFSLGVIMYDMFLGKFPFYFHDNKFRDRVYRKESYCDYWFHNPEGNAFRGESLVFPLIEALIIRCLHPDPSHRPELEWMVFILRGCLDYFY